MMPYSVADIRGIPSLELDVTELLDATELLDSTELLELSFIQEVKVYNGHQP